MPLAAFAISFFVSLLLMPLVIRLAWATGYLDQPHARKLHIKATPLLGGAGVFLFGVLGWGATMRTLPHAWRTQLVLSRIGRTGFKRPNQTRT